MRTLFLFACVLLIPAAFAEDGEHATTADELISGRSAAPAKLNPDVVNTLTEAFKGVSAADITENWGSPESEFNLDESMRDAANGRERGLFHIVSRLFGTIDLASQFKNVATVANNKLKELKAKEPLDAPYINLMELLKQWAATSLVKDSAVSKADAEKDYEVNLEDVQVKDRMAAFGVERAAYRSVQNEWLDHLQKAANGLGQDQQSGLKFVLDRVPAQRLSRFINWIPQSDAGKLKPARAWYSKVAPMLGNRAAPAAPSPLAKTATRDQAAPLSASSAGQASGVARAPAQITRQSVANLLQSKCFGCHDGKKIDVIGEGPNMRIKAGRKKPMDLRTFAASVKGFGGGVMSNEDEVNDVANKLAAWANRL